MTHRSDPTTTTEAFQTLVDEVNLTDVSQHGAFDDDEYMFYVVLYKWLAPILFGLIITIGVVGNLIVIFVTLTSRRMRTTVNVLLLNLAVSDLTFLVVCVPFIAYHYSADNWAIGDVACKLSQYVLYVTVYVTVYTLVAIAVVRFIRIVRSCHPRRGGGLRRTTNTRSRVRMSLAAAILAVIWTTMLAANWPVLAMYRVKAFVTEGEMTAYYYCGSSSSSRIGLQQHLEPFNSTSLTSSGVNDPADPDNRPRALFLTFFLLSYVIPLTIIASMYMLIARYLHRKRHQSSLLLTSSARSATSSGSGRAQNGDANYFGRSRSTTATAARARHRTSYTWRVFCSVVILFAVCWLPLHIHLLIAYFGRQPGTRSYAVYRVFSHCLAYFESCVNPLVYHYVSADFRRGLSELTSAIRHRSCADPVTVLQSTGSRRRARSNDLIDQVIAVRDGANDVNRITLKEVTPAQSHRY